jgi:alanine dehydrogenase
MVFRITVTPSRRFQTSGRDYKLHPCRSLLTEFDVRTVLTMDDLIDAMEQALIQFSTGAVQQPLRTIVDIGGRGFFGVMPALLSSPPALGTKLVSVIPGNARANLPTHLATILLHDPDTGELLAIMDGRYITEARTAAVSAVATRLLARDDAGRVGIIGSGVQARSHLEALDHVRRLTDVRVWSPSEEHLSAFVREMRHRTSARLLPALSAREAVDGAPTSSSWPPARANRSSRATGSPTGPTSARSGRAARISARWTRRSCTRARLFVDSRTGALAEAGDIVIPIAEGAFAASHIVAELGEVAAGRVPGRTSRDEVTIFKSLGMAVEDVAAAQLAYERATARGLGRGVVI